MRSLVPTAALLCLLLAAMACDVANAQLPFEKPPIQYSKTPTKDPVSELGEQLSSGQIKLSRDAESGYLNDLLKRLNIPVESQTLVFAKNSLQRVHISPDNPRAIYFNDQSYVGFVPGGDLIEIASTDPQLGTTFYVIDQDDTTGSPAITRKTQRCLFCHASSHTGRVPGLMMLSVFTDSSGHRVFPSDSIFPLPDGPLAGRFAGWYVSGRHGKQSHLGNAMITSDDVVTSESKLENGNKIDLSRWFETTKYPAPHSDLIALLVLQHQVTMHNQLTQANYQARRTLYEAGHHAGETKAAQLEPKTQPGLETLSDETKITLDQIAEELVDHLLMVDGVTFSSPVSGTSPFAETFAALGPFDSKGRSLRELDLHSRLFRYPCSYLIYSESFDALPSPLHRLIEKRLVAILKGKDQREKYQHLTPERRDAILGILRETKTTLKLP